MEIRIHLHLKIHSESSPTSSSWGEESGFFLLWLEGGHQFKGRKWMVIDFLLG